MRKVLRKVRMLLIKLIAGGRPVILNVYIKDRAVEIYGNGALLSNISIAFDQRTDAALRINPGATNAVLSLPENLSGIATVRNEYTFLGFNQ